MSRTEKPIIIAHRGASAIAPENTLAAFRKALEFPFVKMIELDVYALPSGEVVVIHDDTVDRTTDGKGYVMKSSFAYLRSLDARRRMKGRGNAVGEPERIPTLNEVLDLVDRKAKVNIELKGPNTTEPVKTIIEQYIAKGWAPEDFLVSSFDLRELEKFKKRMPETPVGVLFDNKPARRVEFAAGMKAFSLNPSIKCVSKTMVEEARCAGLKVFCWTVRTPAEVEKMCRLGVDGIFVNDPAMAYETIEAFDNGNSVK